MKQKIVFLIWLFLLLNLPSCNSWKINRLQVKGKVETQDFFHDLDFEFRRGLVVVKARINNSKDTFEFIFDTGAYTSIISREVAEALRLVPKATRRVGDSRGNTGTMEVVQLDKIELGELTFKNIAAGVIDFPDNSAIECIAKDGIIGANLIRECHWKFDFKAKKIWMTDDFGHFPETKQHAAYAFSHNRKNGKPYVSIKMNDYTMNRFLIDMGSNGGFDVPVKWLNKHDGFLAEKPLVTNYDGTSTGLWGRNLDTTQVALIDSLQLGPHRLHSWRVDFNQKGNPKVGMELLAYFDLYLNYETSELFLIPTQELEPYELNVFGFVPDYATADFFVVRNLFEPSPASEAGLMLGDTLTHINGKKPADYYDGFCDYFQWAGELLRGNDSLTVTKHGEEILLKRAKLFE